VLIIRAQAGFGWKFSTIPTMIREKTTRF